MNWEDKPFLVIASQSPAFTSLYSDITDSRREPKGDLVGTTCVIGGCNFADDGMLRPAGLMQAWLGESTWLIPEAVIAWLAEKLHHVILVREPRFNDPIVDCARQGGMKVIGGSNLIVCHGPGQAMRLIHWLNLNPGNQSTLLAFRANGIAFDRSLIQAARGNTDVSSMLCHFKTSGWANSTNEVDYRKFCCLSVWLGGREDSDVIINTTLADANTIKQHCCEYTKELGAALYDAGSITDLERAGYFNLKRIEHIPESWIRIA